MGFAIDLTAPRAPDGSAGPDNGGEFTRAARIPRSQRLGLSMARFQVLPPTPEAPGGRISPAVGAIGPDHP